MLNRVSLIGHLGKDPEIRATQGGDKVGNFSLATSERWTDKNTGEKKEKTEWHRVVVFGDGICGVLEKYVKKGSKLYVEGSLQTRKWTTEAGEDRYTTEVVVTKFGGQITLLDKQESHHGQADRSLANATPESYGQTRTREPAGDADQAKRDAYAPPRSKVDDEIPF